MMSLLGHIGKQVAMAVEMPRLRRNLRVEGAASGRERLPAEEIRQQHNFKEIIGGSPALKRVLRQVETVAPLIRRC
jgi:transcriptional regulator with GAF, ATPase, and Fis domain